MLTANPSRTGSKTENQVLALEENRGNQKTLMKFPLERWKTCRAGSNVHYANTSSANLFMVAEKP